MNFLNIRSIFQSLERNINHYNSDNILNDQRSGETGKADRLMALGNVYDLLKLLLLILIEIGATHVINAQSPVIDANYPGGNIIVEKVDGDTIFLKPDLRDTQPGEWWFYWNFRVSGAMGRTLHFRFTEQNPFNLCGPVISHDAGQTWSRMGGEAVRQIEGQKAWEFSYTFPVSNDEIRFCFTIPYVQKDLDNFLARYISNPNLDIGVLCRSRKGRNVECLRLGKIDGEPKYKMLFTARHHACETLANYVLEGIIDAILADTPDGKAWREQIEVMIIPFMDKDGVEDGDQGKVRAPHDHNRDYSGQSIYPEVAALRKLVPAWLEEKPVFALDIHCPYIRDQYIYFAGGKEEAFMEIAHLLESTQKGLMHFSLENCMPYRNYKKDTSVVEPAKKRPGKSCSAWAGRLPNVIFASTLEFPYSNLKVDLIPETIRAFGYDLAHVILQFITMTEPSEIDDSMTNLSTRKDQNDICRFWISALR